MKFLECNGNTNGGYYGFTFEKHDASDVSLGDLIWSNGRMVEISDYIGRDDLNNLISTVTNKHAFIGALLRCGFDA